MSTTLTAPNTLLAKPPSLTTKAPAATPAAEAKTAAFAAKPKAAKAARKPLTLADPAADYLKIAVYAGTGCGKTLTLAHILEAGNTVLAVSTDFGGEGFTSVRQYLKDRGNEHLLANCYFFELQTYDEVEDFVFNPSSFWPEIFDHDIDVLFFDGGSSFQQCLLSDKVLSMSSQGNATEAREAGLFASQQDWGAIKTGTVKILDKFLRMKNDRTGKSYSKVMTFLESDKAKDSNGEQKIGPMLQGAGAKLVEPCFDLIIRARKKRVTEGTTKTIQYLFEMDGSSDRIITKSRGFKFNPTEPGDFGAIWRSACSQKGIPAGKR